MTPIESSQEKKIIHSNFFICIICGVISVFVLWWSKDYLQFDKIYNPGDVLFPYNLQAAVIDRFDSWNHASNLGFGKNEGYSSPVTGIFFSLLLLFQKMGVQEEVINRIYLGIPTLLLGISCANFLLEVVPMQKIGKMLAVAGVIFFITSLPLTTLDPLLQLGWLSIIYLLVIIFKSNNERINLKQIILGSICIAILSTTPRLIMMMAILFGLNMIIINNKWRLLKIFIIMSILALPIYAITIFPSIFPEQIGKYTGFISEELIKDRKSVIDFYKDSVSISRSLLLHYDQPYSWYVNLFKEETVLAASIVILAIIIYIYLKGGKYKFNSTNFLLINFSVLILITASFGSAIYRLITKIIPGFWILNNPQYPLSIASIFFSGLLCAGVEKICNDLQINKKYKFILYLILFMLVISINRVMIFNKIKYDGKIELGQHQEYFKTPEYKSQTLKILNCDFAKALLLPSSSNGYYTYKSWPITGMPNIYVGNYCINVIGASNEEINNFRVINKDLADSFEFISLESIQNNGIKYIINQKDVKEVEANNNLNIYNSIYNKINIHNSTKIFEDNSIEIYAMNKYKPYININGSNNESTIIHSSKQATSYYIPLKAGIRYDIETLIPKNSAWNIVLLHSSRDVKKLSLVDEYKMLTAENKMNNDNSQFINWELSPKESSRAIIYNKASIVNYPYLLVTVIITYYLLLTIIFLSYEYIKKRI
jgi:hypothetical protein